MAAGGSQPDQQFSETDDGGGGGHGVPFIARRLLKKVLSPRLRGEDGQQARQGVDGRVRGLRLAVGPSPGRFHFVQLPSSPRYRREKAIVN